MRGGKGEGRRGRGDIYIYKGLNSVTREKEKKPIGNEERERRKEKERERKRKREGNVEERTVPKG